MELRRDNMESLLAMLGEAHQVGVFSDRAARNPWRAEVTATQSRGHKRHSWLWVGGPLTAAAAVVVLFVGPALFSGRDSNVALNVTNDILPVQPELHADAVVNPGTEVLDCDFNGDGKIDGLDIQAAIDFRQQIAGDPEAEQEFLRKVQQLSRCMLEGGS